MRERNEHAIVLSGGGARGAYQAGALRAMYEICRERNHFALFKNLVGVSAGAINAAFLAAEAGNLDRATQKMCDMWRNLTANDVFDTDYLTVSRTALRLARGVSLGGFSSKLRPTKVGLLSVNPLRDLLKEHIHFSAIPENIRDGKLDSLCITATDYSTAMGVTFFMGAPDINEWRRVGRVGIRENIGIDHVMASASIPVFFPPWPIGERHFGDGCLRNTAPLSPARKIGGRKILVIGVRKIKSENLDSSTLIKPTLGRVLSVVINAIFVDAIEVDIERVKVINESLRFTGKDSLMKRIDIAHVHPSRVLSELAESRVEGLPPVLRFLLSGLGTPRESAEILSYLAFDPEYLNALVDLGYHDLIKQKENLIQILSL
jgi:NTE family protein